MNLQLSDQKKIKLSDFVICNNKDKKNLEVEFNKVLNEIILTK